MIDGDPLLMCRRHLAERMPISRAAGGAIAGRSLEIRRRLLCLIESMTDRGQAATAQEDASWLEALGWFAGWGLPLYLSTPAGRSAQDPEKESNE